MKSKNVNKANKIKTLSKKALELTKPVLTKLLEIKEKFIFDKASKEDVKAIELKYYKEVLPSVKLLYQEAVALEETIEPEDYAILNGAIPLKKELYDNATFTNIVKKLDDLRMHGEYEIATIQDMIKSIALKHTIEKDAKKEQISIFKKELEAAKGIERQNHEDVKKLTRQATALAKLYGDELYRFAKLKNKQEIKLTEIERDNKLKQEKERFKEVKASTPRNNKQFVITKHEALVNEIIRDANEKIASCKDETNDAYIAKYNYYRRVRNNRLTVAHKVEHGLKGYAHEFTFKGFMLRNALYFVIIAFFVTCVIISAVQGSQLLTTDTLVTILSQSSTKMFFSLGVAGLILLGGTDLSIGRMTGMVATFSCMFLSRAAWTTNFGKLDFSGFGVAGSVILGIIVCIVVATLFSSVAGFFTAKFKMHPFITTLSTQLLIFGLMMICFSQVSAFKMDDVIKEGIVGVKGWQLILYAAVAVAIMWFIWNKTKFGRHMYAVGDNKEAAKVSGINVFAITMGVFIMAGVCYGLGGFFEGARIGSANPSLGLGTELDAIAACVIGGISFSGGRGKIRGAVIGTIIFTTLTYCLTFIGLDSNYQYIFKGLIILAAVCLDSLKFIEKK